MKIEKITPAIAALYLGQKCDAVWVTGSLKGHKVKGDNQGITPTMVSLMCPDQIANQLEITPHLRRLESMTEAEAREVYEIEHGKEFKSDTYISAKVFMVRGGELDYFTPQGFLHLLSKGFDLFGLIDSGLAKEIVAQS